MVWVDIQDWTAQTRRPCSRHGRFFSGGGGMGGRSSRGAASISRYSCSPSPPHIPAPRAACAANNPPLAQTQEAERGLPTPI